MAFLEISPATSQNSIFFCILSKLPQEYRCGFPNEILEEFLQKFHRRIILHLVQGCLYKFLRECYPRNHLQISSRIPSGSSLKISPEIRVMILHKLKKKSRGASISVMIFSYIPLQILRILSARIPPKIHPVSSWKELGKNFSQIYSNDSRCKFYRNSRVNLSKNFNTI